MRDDVRCYVRWADYAARADIYFVLYVGEQAKALSPDGEWVDFDESSEPVCALKLTGVRSYGLLGKLAQALSEAGVKPPERSHLEGKLEAQTAHLADLRRLIPELKGV